VAVNRGILVALEGLDGCGKTTQAARIGEALRARGRDVVLTREPSDGPIGRKIRELARGRGEVPAVQQLQLFTDDRRQHVAQVIAPALAAGRTVITDRYFLSTVAYQGARGLPWREILSANEAEFPAPDLALIFELPVALGLARARARGGAPDLLFERADYLAEVSAIFAAIDRPYVARVDASGSADAVGERALVALRERIDSV
jgi:dTMP kinase